MRNTVLPESLAWQPILREPLLAMIHRDHPLAQQEAVSLAALVAEPFVFFDPHVGTGLYDDILGLMRRYGLSPVITQEVGEAGGRKGGRVGRRGVGTQLPGGERGEGG